MIGHAPIETSAGILIHLQTSSGSFIHLDDQVISNEGRSPAIPLQIGNDVFLGTSEHVIHLSCESTCTEQGRTEFHTNGEIMPYFSDEGDDGFFPKKHSRWQLGRACQEMSCRLFIQTLEHILLLELNRMRVTLHLETTLEFSM